MKKVILDTNIYGRVLELKDYEFVLSQKSKVMVYGSVVIRKELRETDAGAMIDYEERQRKLRILLLTLYDSLVGEKNLGVTPAIERLAEQYFSVYKKLGGKASFPKIIEDFTIMATATLHNLELVYSEDKGTMRSEEARKAYLLVNDLHNLPTPLFRSYEEFKQELKKSERAGEKGGKG